MSKASVSATAGLFVAACLIVYANSRVSADDGSLKFGQKPLGNFDVFSVGSITFEKSATESTVIRRNASHRWEVQNGPTAFSIDDARLRSFFVQLISMQVGDRVPGAESHLRALGFPGSGDPAALGSSSRAGGRISLRQGESNGSSFEILTGKSRPVGSGMYASFSGKPEVYLIAENLAPLYDPDYWRDKAILDATEKNIAAIELLSWKGAPRIERASASSPWRQKGSGGARPTLPPGFMYKGLPQLTDSLRELQFVRVIQRKPNEALEKFKVATVGFELFSGKIYTVSVYERPNPDSSKEYFASFQVRLVPGFSFGKFASFGLATDIADFNAKGASWFYILDEAAAKRFLAHQR